MTKSRDDEILGQSFHVASRRLYKMVLFSLLEALGRQFCFRCQKVMQWQDISLDHVIAWRGHERPVDVFFDIANVKFSHLGCNAAVADKTNAIAAKKRITHCPHGHEYTETNTAVYNGKRRCRSCMRNKRPGSVTNCT